MNDASWSTRPTVEDIAAAYPKEAAARAATGGVALRCQLTASGSIEGCKIFGESPRGLGFGAAAVTLASKLSRPPGTPKTVEIGISFDPTQRSLGAPAQPGADLTSADVKFLQKPGDLSFYFPERAQRLGRSGMVVLGCGVDSDGSLRLCAVKREEPQGFEFGQAAQRILSKARLAPSTNNGEPTAGRNFLYEVPFKAR